MSDFYTKKQRKFWCEKCRIFIEYSNMMIEQHNKSKNHMKMINADKIYYATKSRIMKHNLPNIMINSNINNNDKDNSNYSNINYLNKKTDRGRSNSLNQMILEEVKKEKMSELLKNKHNKFPKQNKKWEIFFDASTNLPYYYNYITKASQWDRPDDYEDPKLENSATNLESNEKIITKKVNNEGIIGKWEIVEKNETVSEKNKTNNSLNSYMPGIISYNDYIRSIQEEDPYENIDEDEFNDPIHELHSQILDKKLYESNFSNSLDIPHKKKLSPMDNEIYYPKDEEDPNSENKLIEFSVQKDVLIELNNKLKNKDYDSRHETQIWREKDDTKSNQPLEISFNKVKKNEKKKFAPIFNDNDDF